MSVPRSRIQPLIQTEAPSGGQYVLYWMTSARRTRYNFALERALELCAAHDKPLLVFESIRLGYRWASQRFHQFMAEGMNDTQTEFERAGVRYFRYLEPETGHGKGLLQALAAQAVAVVTDDFPCFFLPRMLEGGKRALERLDKPPPLEVVDSNGVFPMRSTERVFTTAQSFRIFLRKNLSGHIGPKPTPLARYSHGLARFPKAVQSRWGNHSAQLSDLSFTLDVPAGYIPGGSTAARKHLKRFIQTSFRQYGQDRNHPDADGASGLSPYLHFGHLSTHEVLAAIVRADEGQPKGDYKSPLVEPQSEAAASFNDELITWREIGYNLCSHRDDYDQLGSLPAWALATIDDHRSDVREHVYTLDEFESARTHDEVWNAAQTQLVREGRMHNYLRMLWGKKIYEWSATPEDALAVMIELNNKYALDGCNPNSYSGIFWVLGRYDRAWGPERPVFGKLRFMSTESARRKLRLKHYLQRYSADMPGSTLWGAY